jgi:N6-adenosine-specific RNA methylase IME4
MRPVKRWTPHRKYFIVQGVRDGSLNLAAVMRVHGISYEEYAIWARSIASPPIGISIKGSEMTTLLPGLLQKHFSCVLADPPWRFASNSVAKPGRNAMRHYDCMSLDDIAALPVAECVANDAVLFMWITGPFLAIAAHIPIMRAWGFKPSGMGFVWVKLNRRAPELFTARQDLAMGGGFTTRKNAEFCLIGKRGRSLRLDAGIHEIIIAPRREHSRKPIETHHRIERYCAGPRLELFARESRDGWTTWGNQAGKFDQPVLDVAE